MKTIYKTLAIASLLTLTFSCTKRYTCECYVDFYSNPSQNYSPTYSIEARTLSEATTECKEWENLDNPYYLQTCTAYLD